MKTTIECDKEAKTVLHKWKRHYGMKSINELIWKWIDVVRCHKQKELYDRLPTPNAYKKRKPLAGKKIKKSYRKKECVI